MSLVTVTEDLGLPSGVNPRGITVTIFLAGTDGKPLPAGYATVAGQTIIGQHQFNPATDGTWSKDLNANADITPANTAWGIKLSGPGNAGVSPVPRYILVPAGGPYVLETLLTDPPGTLDPAGLALAIARIIVLEAEMALVPLTYVPLLQHSATVGITSIVGSDLAVDVTSQWGIDTGGVPYFDTAGATAGEEALFHIEPDGTASWVLLTEVH